MAGSAAFTRFDRPVVDRVVQDEDLAAHLDGASEPAPAATTVPCAFVLSRLDAMLDMPKLVVVALVSSVLPVSVVEAMVEAPPASMPLLKVITVEVAFEGNG